MVTKEMLRDGKYIMRSLGNLKGGYFVGASKKKGDYPMVLKIFGCMRCSWLGSEMCPHGKRLGEHHANWICKERIDYIKETMRNARDLPRVIQQEKVVELKLLTERMLAEYGETGELHEDYKHLIKNLSGLIDKMRRQDEGIKMQGEVDITVHDFRKVVDAQAKALDGKNILEADVIQQDN